MVVGLLGQMEAHLAQSGGSAADPFAPWLQLIIQAGALGILILLGFQVPKILKALKEWRQETEKAHMDERSLIRQDNERALKIIIDHCEERDKRSTVYLDSLQKEIENLQETMSLFTKSKRPPRHLSGGETERP